MIFGNETQTSSVTDQYLRDAVHPMIWKKNAVTFPNGKEWVSKQKWLVSPDPQGHEDTVRYLTYGCTYRLVDGVDKRYQTYHAVPDTYPTKSGYACAPESVWFPMTSQRRTLIYTYM